MKKLSCFSDDHWVVIRATVDKLNEAIDLVNSQQEAIEKLESKVWTADFIEKYRPALENLAKADDTHRTVTLRIPKGKRIGQAISNAAQGYPLYISDTDLQKALDELKGESNE